MNTKTTEAQQSSFGRSAAQRSSGVGRIPAIDGLRALAMLMVFWCHGYEYSGTPKHVVSVFGYPVDLLAGVPKLSAGVDLFMVLSGFCLFLPLCKPGAMEKWNIKNFFVRRVRRIAPPYYAAIAFAVLLPNTLAYLLQLSGREAYLQPWDSWFQIVTHVLFIHTFFADTTFGLAPAFWSLGLEAQFYAIFPLVVLGYQRYGTRVLWWIAGVTALYSVFAGYWTQNDQLMVQWTWLAFFPGLWAHFAMGMGAAIIVSRFWKEERKLSARQGTFALSGALVLYTLANSLPDFQWPLLGMLLRHFLLGVVFTVVLLSICVTQTSVRAFFENRVMVWLGFISYSVFLIHQPIQQVLAGILRSSLGHRPELFLLVISTVVLALVIALSWLFFLIFERPFLQAPKQRVTAENASRESASRENAESVNTPTEVLTTADKLPAASLQDQAVP